MVPHLAERIEYAKDELAWLEKGAPESEEPWRGWDTMSKDAATFGEGGWLNLDQPPRWFRASIYRRRPAMLHVIDANGKRWEFPQPMREALRRGQNYWAIMADDDRIICSSWWDDPADEKRLKLGRCQSTKDGAQQQLAALRAVCLGGEV
jgi:hypothetical protein